MLTGYQAERLPKHHVFLVVKVVLRNEVEGLLCGLEFFVEGPKNGGEVHFFG